MATGGSDPSTRMSTENKRICDIALNLFKKYKVEISDAINTTFPFLEYLRDHGFITSEMYKHSHQSLTKRHGVQEVIYDVLTELEKTFDLSILEALFSKVIMKKYPDLYNIYKIFKTAIPDLELSPECEMERRPDVQLSLEQGTVKKPLSSLTWLYQDPSDYNGTAPPENELAEPLRETQLKHENETLPTTSALKTQQANEQFFQESKPAVLSSDEDELTEASTGEQRSNPVISSDEDEPAKASTGEQRMNPGTVDLGNSFTLAKIKRKRTIPDLELSPECEMEQRPDVQLSLEQGTVKKLLPSLTWLYQDPSDYNGIAPPENEFAELLHETQLINGNETISTTSDDKSVLETQQANEQCAQESEPAGEELLHHVNQINSRPGDLMNLKKEKPFVNSGVEWQAHTRIDGDRASAAIVISSDEDEPAKASTGEQRRNPVINYNLHYLQSDEEGDTQEATCSAPNTAAQPVDFRKSPVCRKRLWKTGRSREGSSESSADETPPVLWRSAERSPDEEDSTDIENQPTWMRSNKKKRINSDDSSELSNGEEPQETSSSALRNGSGAELQGTGNEECPCVMCSSKGVPRGQEAKAESTQASDMMDNMDIGRKSTLGKHSRKRRRKRRRKGKLNSIQRVRGRGRYKTQALRKRVPWKRRKLTVPRIPRDTTIDFRLPILRVTCGQAEGMLYKEKMKQGISAKCIKMKDGKKLTLKEFEIEGNHEKSKNWKLSVRCGGWPLKHLIQNGHLCNPPRIYGRRKKPRVVKSHDKTLFDPYPQNSNHCEVCRKGGTLFCCDTCPQSFHEKCHLQHIDPDRSPWSCIFCQIRAIQERNPENQSCHQESEVLEREMLDEEYLKCAFLLLKAYRCPESSFFASEPYYSQQVPQVQENCMWLNKIKTKLAWKMYPQVKGFVRDMRLIFENLRAFCKDQKFIRMGIQLEANFENNFKNVFAIQ
ncbi:nuclear autoantigen Sp-100-like isoform 3-T3 [Molossus nigricans]